MLAPGNRSFRLQATSFERRNLPIRELKEGQKTNLPFFLNQTCKEMQMGISRSHGDFNHSVLGWKYLPTSSTEKNPELSQWEREMQFLLAVRWWVKYDQKKKKNINTQKRKCLDPCHEDVFGLLKKTWKKGSAYIVYIYIYFCFDSWGAQTAC